MQRLFELALHPLRHYGVGFELHSQNTLIRICKKTKTIKGFAIRDLAGVKIHRPALEKGGFFLNESFKNCSDEPYPAWNKVHHALFQNHIAAMISALRLERGGQEWVTVRSVLSGVLQTDDDAVGREIYRYFTRKTMAFKCFLRVRMTVSSIPPLSPLPRSPSRFMG